MPDVTDRIDVRDHYLDLPVFNHDLDLPLSDSKVTIRRYLTTLLTVLWIEKDSFSGKRPFGNSGWCWDLYNALAQAGIVEGTFDSDGFVATLDTKAADKIIAACIRRLGELR